MAAGSDESKAEAGVFRASCLSCLGEVLATLGPWVDAHATDVLDGCVCVLGAPLATRRAGDNVSCRPAPHCTAHWCTPCARLLPAVV